MKNEEAGGHLGNDGQGLSFEVQRPGAGGQAEMTGVLAEITAETVQARAATGGSDVEEVTAGWLAPRYLLGLRRQLAELPEGPERFRLLRQASGEVVAMRLAGVWAGRLLVERQKLEFLRQRHKEQMEAAAKLLEVNEVKRRDPKQPMTEEELRACVDKVDEIFGLKRATRTVGAIS